MLQNCKSAKERWGGVSDIIDRWLEERQRLLVKYCELCEFIEHDDVETCGTRLQFLCQILVDYVSAGHFEVYEQLVAEGHEFNDKEGLEKASSEYKLIGTTTEYILDFNDKYQETDDLDALESDLSVLGESMASRFEAEDKMIEVLHVSHQHQLVD